jgi:hypothetical protein
MDQPEPPTTLNWTNASLSHRMDVPDHPLKVMFDYPLSDRPPQSDVENVGRLGSPSGPDGGHDALAAFPDEREASASSVLGHVDSTNSTIWESAALPIPLLAWTEMPLLKATM